MYLNPINYRYDSNMKVSFQGTPNTVINITKESLEQLLNKQKTLKEIAQILNCSIELVQKNT